MEEKISFLFISLAIIVFISCAKDPVSVNHIKVNEVEIAPDEAGWSSAKLEQARIYTEQIGSAAVMALFDGKVFLSWGEVSTNYFCDSIRKFFLNSLYGIHIKCENINLKTTLEELSIDDIPPSLSQEEKQATIKDLIQSRSGVYHAAAAEPQWVIDSRPVRGSHSPGTFFYYNNWDFNVAGTIFEEQTGTKIFEEFKKQIADPLGMKDFGVDNCFFQYEWEKSMHPAYIFQMSARDMAKFGALYQKNGNWNGLQLIPGDWIAESTTAYSILFESIDWKYGYLCEIYPYGAGLTYGHQGGIGHWIVIIPEIKFVFVHHAVKADFDNGQMVQLLEMILNARVD